MSMHCPLSISLFRSLTGLLVCCVSITTYAITITSASIQHDGSTQSNTASDIFNESDTGGSLNQVICANGTAETTSPCPATATAAANVSSNITTSNNGFAYTLVVNQSGDANLDEFLAGATAQGSSTNTVQLDEEASYTLQVELAVNCSGGGFGGGAQVNFNPSFGGASLDALADCNNPSATISHSGTLPSGIVHQIDTDGTATFIEPVASAAFDVQYTLTIFLAPEENVPAVNLVALLLLFPLLALIANRRRLLRLKL